MKTCIIPAKANSARLPGKNHKKFLGKPIIRYSYDLALAFGFDHIFVSTTDPTRFGSIPFDHITGRSKATERDDAPMIDVVLEALGDLGGCVCMMYATAPLATYRELAEGYEMLGWRHVVAATYKGQIAGQWYWATADYLRRAQSWDNPAHLEVEYGVDIDTQADWDLAEMMYISRHHASEFAEFKEGL